MSPEFQTLRIDREPGGEVARIVLNRPDLLNRVDDAAHRELITAFRSFEETDVRAIVLAGEGRVFSAGGDFDLMLAGNADPAVRSRMVADGYRLVQALLEIDVPVIAALHGDAIGLGATIALLCDMVVAHPRVRISDPHVAIGLVAGDGGAIAWPAAAGMLRAKRYLLTGEALTGDVAFQIGLVTDLVAEAEDVPPAAEQLAGRIAALPPLAVRGTKRALNDVLRHRFAEVMSIGLAHELTTIASADLREAVAAFRDRRTPTYEGR